ncbi:hypothetical protein FOC4_g10013126 [Fusarium odoratissimum]|uniref:Uncharacterized protein n=1 Tax=Fusarium oxysporum f. sp. cubense (strain race 4) TaxID=2502994 RepID=N1RQ21_FUSC4|nr:hypothetical protein FOC4_g10013126 [Fusarium odoratissimum]
MLRNRALAVLQKTYDDSYLSCSTAIYYEGQGNEIEAMRHWRAALDQIYDYNANRAPPAYGPRTDTEKALQEALKQLELQCKERIDLLEALRISRQEEMTTPQPPPGKLTKRPSIPEGRGSLGQGTITAMQTRYRGWTQHTSRSKHGLPVAFSICIAWRTSSTAETEQDFTDTKPRKAHHEDDFTFRIKQSSDFGMERARFKGKIREGGPVGVHSSNSEP